MPINHMLFQANSQFLFVYPGILIFYRQACNVFKKWAVYTVKITVWIDKTFNDLIEKMVFYPI